MVLRRSSFALAAIAALGLTLVLLQRANEAKIRTLEGEMRRISKVGEEATASAERTERVVPALMRQVVAARSPPEPERPANERDPAPKDEPFDPATAAAQAAAARAEQAAYVDAAYARQGVDSTWAQPARAALDNEITKQLGTSMLESVECRESLCKARLSHQDPASYHGFVNRMLANANDLWKGPIWLYQDPATEGEGAVRNSIYFAKEGTDIPRPSP